MTEEHVQQRYLWIADALPDALKAWREVWPTQQDHFASSDHEQAHALLRALEEAMYCCVALEPAVMGDEYSMNQR